MADMLSKPIKIAYKDFNLTYIGAQALTGINAQAIVGYKNMYMSDNIHSHMPMFYNYGSNTTNWNIRFFNRDTGALITTNIPCTCTMRVFYIP